MANKNIIKGEDGTLKRNSIEHWKFLINEYNLIKNKKHSRFKFVTEFYNFYNLKRQNFIKYLNRYKLSNYLDDNTLLPQKRGPKYNYKISNQNSIFLENKIIELRSNGLNRYEIYNRLKEDYKKTIEKLPSYSKIYNIFKKYKLNRLNNMLIANKKKQIQKIIKDNVGDLVHIDCHYLPKNIIKDNFNRYYLIGIIDDCSRIITLTLTKDIQALTVMFKTLEMINFLKQVYNIEIKELLSDNGSEFGSGKLAKNKDTHPFERLLKELNIKHRYTRPYHPQTNGKIERLWRIIDNDLLEETIFDSEEHLQKEITKYCIYFNELRPHGSLNNKTPKEFMEEKVKEFSSFLSEKISDKK